MAVQRLSDRVNAKGWTSGVRLLSDRLSAPAPALWTLDPADTEVWLDMSRPEGMTLSESNVVSVLDKSGNGRNVTQQFSTLQGVYDSTEGAVAIQNSTKIGNIPEITTDSFLCVIQYKGGADATFDENATLLIDLNNNARIQGFNGTNGWRSSGVPVLSSNSVVNGGALKNDVLPLGKSILRFSYSQITSAFGLLHHYATSTWGFDGFAYEFIFPKPNETLENLQKKEWYLSDKHGIPLDPSHPYAISAPTV